MDGVCIRLILSEFPFTPPPGVHRGPIIVSPIVAFRYEVISPTSSFFFDMFQNNWEWFFF